MKKGKRFLCLLLVVAMTLSIMSTGVLAATANDTQDDAACTSVEATQSLLSKFLTAVKSLLNGDTTDASSALEALFSSEFTFDASTSNEIVVAINACQPDVPDHILREFSIGNCNCANVVSIINGLLDKGNCKAVELLLGALSKNATEFQNVLKSMSCDKLMELLGTLNKNGSAAFDTIISALPTSQLAALLKAALEAKADFVDKLLKDCSVTTIISALKNIDLTKLDPTALINALASLKAVNSDKFVALLNAMKQFLPSSVLQAMIDKAVANGSTIAADLKGLITATGSATAGLNELLTAIANGNSAAAIKLIEGFFDNKTLSNIIGSLNETQLGALAALLKSNTEAFKEFVDNLPSAKLAALLLEAMKDNTAIVGDLIKYFPSASIASVLNTLTQAQVNNLANLLKSNTDAFIILLTSGPAAKLTSMINTLLGSGTGTALINANKDLLIKMIENLPSSRLQALLLNINDNAAQVMVQALASTPSALKALLDALPSAKLTSMINTLLGSDALNSLVQGNGALLLTMLQNLSPAKLLEVLTTLRGQNLAVLQTLLTRNGTVLAAVLGNLANADFIKNLSEANLNNVKALMDIIVGNATASSTLLEALSKLNSDALNNLLTLFSKTQLGQLLSKLGIKNISDLLAKFSNNDLITFFKNLLAKGFSFDQIKTFIANLINNTTNSSLLAKLKALLDNLKALLGLGGSDTDINDDNTPLAGGMLTTDHIAYVQGVGNGKFLPYGPMTRAAAAQMLFNLLTDDSREMYYSTSSTFSDVSSGSWYSAAVSTLANADVIDGYPDGSFKPDRAISRAEFIKLIVAMFGVDESATASYTDLKTTNWAYPYIATATSNGWITGYTDGSCKPTNSIQRGEAVTFMNRVLVRTCDTSYVAAHLSSLNTFTDVKPGLWCYAAVMEAANGHDYSTSTGSEVWTGLK
jgi:hypothetical protein